MKLIISMESEARIVAESKNLYLFKALTGKLELRLNGTVHAVCVGHPRDVEHGKILMEKLERDDCKSLRAMYSHRK